MCYVCPAGKDFASLFEDGTAAKPGATAEPVAVVRPFARGN